MAAEQAISTGDFIQSLGVNTHLDFGGAYANPATVEAAINYLGLDNLRDSPASPADLPIWQQIAQATGAKFDAYVGQVSPSRMSTELDYIQQLAQQGMLNFVEGGDEEDDTLSAAVGNSLSLAAQFQLTLYGVAQSLGLPTINMSFGAGWTITNNWIGDYANVGDLSGIADYANAHIYPAGAPDATIQQLNADALLAAGSRPVIASELGYDTSAIDPTQAAKWTLDAALDGMKDGDIKTYFYALFDDGSGNFGLMNPDGSPRPAGEALHNLTTLLQDSAGSFSPGSLDYTLDNAAFGDNSLLMEKSDGTYWLALWNETNGGHTVTLNLASTASAVEVFDPLTGTTAVQTAGDTNSVQISVPDHPVLVEIVPSDTPAPTTGSASPPPPPTPSGGIVLAAPSSLQATAGQPQSIGGVALSDDYAAGNGSQVTVTASDATGSLTTVDAWGNTQQGSNLTLSGTVWQVNAALTNLSYTANGSNDTITLAATDQAGGQTSQSIPVTDPVGGTIQIAQDDANPVETVSSTAITASAGDHVIFIAGTGDTLTATDGTETVQAYQGGNAITTGAGDDTIRFAGSGNTVDAGGGNNQLEDSGNNNTIVLPAAGQGYDNILGWMLQNGDGFDLRPALAQTAWNGDASTLGNYLQVNMSGNSAIVSIGGSAVATLNDTGNTTLSSFLAHAIT